MIIVRCYTPQVLIIENTRYTNGAEFCGWVCKVESSETTERTWGVTLNRKNVHTFADPTEIDEAITYFKAQGEELTHQPIKMPGSASNKGAPL